MSGNTKTKRKSTGSRSKATMIPKSKATAIQATTTITNNEKENEGGEELTQNDEITNTVEITDGHNTDEENTEEHESGHEDIEETIETGVGESTSAAANAAATKTKAKPKGLTNTFSEKSFGDKQGFGKIDSMGRATRSLNNNRGMGIMNMDSSSKVPDELTQKLAQQNQTIDLANQTVGAVNKENEAVDTQLSNRLNEINKSNIIIPDVPSNPRSKDLFSAYLQTIQSMSEKDLNDIMYEYVKRKSAQEVQPLVNQQNQMGTINYTSPPVISPYNNTPPYNPNPIIPQPSFLDRNNFTSATPNITNNPVHSLVETVGPSTYYYNQTHQDKDYVNGLPVPSTMITLPSRSGRELKPMDTAEFNESALITLYNFVESVIPSVKSTASAREVIATYYYLYNDLVKQIHDKGIPGPDHPNYVDVNCGTFYIPPIKLPVFHGFLFGNQRVTATDSPAKQQQIMAENANARVVNAGIFSRPDLMEVNAYWKNGSDNTYRTCPGYVMYKRFMLESISGDRDQPRKNLESFVMPEHCSTLQDLHHWTSQWKQKLDIASWSNANIYNEQAKINAYIRFLAPFWKDNMLGSASSYRTLLEAMSAAQNLIIIKKPFNSTILTNSTPTYSAPLYTSSTTLGTDELEVLSRYRAAREAKTSNQIIQQVLEKNDTKVSVNKAVVKDEEKGSTSLKCTYPKCLQMGHLIDTCWRNPDSKFYDPEFIKRYPIPGPGPKYQNNSNNNSKKNQTWKGKRSHSPVNKEPEGRPKPTSGTFKCINCKEDLHYTKDCPHINDTLRKYFKDHDEVMLRNIFTQEQGITFATHGIIDGTKVQRILFDNGSMVNITDKIALNNINTNRQIQEITNQLCHLTFTLADHKTTMKPHGSIVLPVIFGTALELGDVTFMVIPNNEGNFTIGSGPIVKSGVSTILDDGKGTRLRNILQQEAPLEIVEGPKFYTHRVTFTPETNETIQINSIGSPTFSEPGTSSVEPPTSSSSEGESDDDLTIRELAKQQTSTQL